MNTRDTYLSVRPVMFVVNISHAFY